MITRVELQICWAKFDYCGHKDIEPNPVTAVLEGEITAVWDTLANTAQLRTMDILWGRRDVPRSEVRPPEDKIPALLRPLRGFGGANANIAINMPDGSAISTAELAER